AKVLRMIGDGEVDGAVDVYDKAARTIVRWPPRADLYAFIKALHGQKAEVASVRLMRDFCKYHPDAPEAPKVRLKLAQVLIRDLERPGEALRHLEAVPAGALAPDMEAARLKLAAKARAMQEEGVLELEGDH
ncbi:MAG: rhomboid family intramembrane serine protease, partial [Thermoleophilia bacterium]|nr:rhomboid family intramembrane serine protease [Thermoleophilia bacterium]